MPKGYPNKARTAIKTAAEMPTPEAEIFAEDFTLQAFDQTLGEKCALVGIEIDENAYHYSYTTKVWHDPISAGLAQAAGISYEAMLHMGYEKVTDHEQVCPYNQVLMRISKAKWDARERIVSKPVSGSTGGDQSVTISTDDFVELKDALDKAKAHRADARNESQRRVAGLESNPNLDAFKGALAGGIGPDND